MPTRNLLNSNIWQIVSPDINNEPQLIYNKYIPIPTNTLVGGVRPDGITTVIDAFGVITAIGNGAIGNGQFVPYVSFTSSATASAGQIFGSNILSYYQGNASFATVSVDGAILRPYTDFTISLNTIQILAYLEPFSLVELQAKTLPVVLPQDIFLTSEDGNILITQAGDNISIQQVFG